MANVLALPFKSTLELSVEFSWYPIFASPSSSSLSLGGFPTSQPIALPNLAYERLSVLHNIAALHSAIGASSRRTDQDGIKLGIAAFQRAAGVLSHLIALLPSFNPDPPALSPPSPDLSPRTIEALRDICLAQAQEAFWQKGVMDRLKNGTIAKLAAKVAEYYDAAAKAAVEAKGAPETWPAFAFPPALLNHLAIKHLHFAAVAQFRKSIDDLGANRYGDELGRLRVAEGYTAKALDGPKKGVAESVIRDLKGLQQTLLENITRADKDNRLIYLEAPTPLSSLRALLPASMVKPTPPNEITNPLAYLHNSPGGLGSMQAVSQPVGLPPSLLSKAQEVRSSGGSSRLRTMMHDVRRVAKVDQQILSEANAHLAQRAAGLEATLNAARASDQLVRAKFGEWEERIDRLGGDEKSLEASIPSLSTPSLTLSQSTPLTTLRTFLEALDDIRASRSRTVADAKFACLQDDIRSEVLKRAVPGDGGTAQFETLFEERMEGFARYRREVGESASRQEDALDRIKTANAAFVASRKSDERVKLREKALQDLEAAFHKFRELATNLAEGLKFYADVAGLLNELRDSCKQWAYARDVESRDQMGAITAALECVRLKVARPGVYDPTKDGPIRFG
ncbi:hypothetical protein RQP46_003601 [Phenoliferia psychrophenolica]